MILFISVFYYCPFIFQVSAARDEGYAAKVQANHLQAENDVLRNKLDAAVAESVKLKVGIHTDQIKASAFSNELPSFDFRYKWKIYFSSKKS